MEATTATRTSIVVVDCWLGGCDDALLAWACNGPCWATVVAGCCCWFCCCLTITTVSAVGRGGQAGVVVAAAAVQPGAVVAWALEIEAQLAVQRAQGWPLWSGNW